VSLRKGAVASRARVSVRLEKSPMTESERIWRDKNDDGLSEAILNSERFHTGTSSGGLGELGELFVEHECLDVRVCPL